MEPIKDYQLKIWWYVDNGEFVLFSLFGGKHHQWLIFEIDDVIDVDVSGSVFEFLEIYCDIAMAVSTEDGLDIVMTDGMKISITLGDEIKVMVNNGENNYVAKKCKFNNFNYLSRAIETRFQEMEKNADDMSNTIIECLKAKI